MKLYRYLRGCDELFQPSIQLSEHEVIRDTKKCYVIERHKKGVGKCERFILKDPNGKRWAYAEKIDALNYFKHRTMRSISISKVWIEEGEKYLKLANELKI